MKTPEPQNPSPFSNRPPLPTPDGNVFAPEPMPLPQRGDWKSAPLVVKGWAYIVTWLSIVFIPVVMVAGFFDEKAKWPKDLADFSFCRFVLHLRFGSIAR